MKEEFEDTKGVIRIPKSKKDRQHNGQKTEEQTAQWPKDRRTDNTMTNRKRKNNDLENIHTKNSLKTGVLQTGQ